MNYKVVPIADEILQETRDSMKSPQYKSLAATVSIATGYGPCRSCLQVFREGQDERIYFTYNSFAGIADLPDPGPVFIHRDECERFSQIGFPPDLLGLPLLFEGFGDESELIRRVRLEANAAESQIGSIFADSSVRFINLRNAEAGCYVARVERTN